MPNAQVTTLQRRDERKNKKSYIPYCIRIALSSFSYYMWMWSLHYGLWIYTKIYGFIEFYKTPTKQ